MRGGSQLGLFLFEKLMKELVKIAEENGKQLVSARELHEALEVKTRFNDWIVRKMVASPYFIENEDFTRLLNFERAGQKALEYALTLDTAKKISMAESTDKGNEVRDYFIACEKKLQLQLPQTYADALRAYADVIEQKELAEGKIQSLEESLDESEQWISIVRASKEFEKPETFFKWRELKAYSIENGIEIKKAPCPRFKFKNLYHISVFKNIYNL